MATKKRPALPRDEFEQLLRRLEQAPRLPEAVEQELPHFSPWNVSAKTPAVKRTIAFSLSEEKE